MFVWILYTLIFTFLLKWHGNLWEAFFDITIWCFLHLKRLHKPNFSPILSHPVSWLDVPYIQPAVLPADLSPWGWREEKQCSKWTNGAPIPWALRRQSSEKEQLWRLDAPRWCDSGLHHYPMKCGSGAGDGYALPHAKRQETEGPVEGLTGGKRWDFLLNRCLKSCHDSPRTSTTSYYTVVTSYHSCPLGKTLPSFTTPGWRLLHGM